MPGLTAGINLLRLVVARCYGLRLPASRENMTAPVAGDATSRRK